MNQHCFDCLVAAILMRACKDTRSRSASIRVDAIAWLVEEGADWAAIIGWPPDRIERLLKCGRKSNSFVL